MRSTKRRQGEYVVALTAYRARRSWLRAVGLKPMSLGLDLRGGVHFMYEVDVDGAVDKRSNAWSATSVRQLRDDRIPYHGSVVDRKTGTRHASRQRGGGGRIASAIQGDDPGITITNESVEDQVVLTRRASRRSSEVNARTSRFSRTSRRCAIASMSWGVAEPIVQPPGRRIASSCSCRACRIPTRRFACSARPRLWSSDWSMKRTIRTKPRARKRVPIGSKLYRKRDGRPILLKRDVIATGEQLTDATSRFSEGAPEVNVTLDARGGQEMLEATRDNVGRRMAVVYIESKSLAEGELCEGARYGDVCTEESVITAATIQERAVVELSHHRAAVGRSARAGAAAAFRRAGGTAAHRRATVGRSEAR